MAARLRHPGGLPDRDGELVLLPRKEEPAHQRLRHHADALHLIVFDAEFDTDRLIATLADLRKFTGRTLSDYCNDHLPACFRETLRAQATEDRQRRFWQPSRHPIAIQSEPFWQQKVDYLHDNPCRKGLVRLPEHWRYSSAAWYASDGKNPVDVPLTAIVW
jgi:hypothetical protein